MMMNREMKIMTYAETDLDLALPAYIDHIDRDYRTWQGKTSGKGESDFQKQMALEFTQSLKVIKGSKFLKVVKGNSVHSFVCVKAHDKFVVGDILKAASYAAPAKNFIRGNILDVASYENRVTWTGAL
jgi:hypothetical protein